MVVPNATDFFLNRRKPHPLHLESSGEKAIFVQALKNPKAMYPYFLRSINSSFSVMLALYICVSGCGREPSGPNGWLEQARRNLDYSSYEEGASHARKAEALALSQEMVDDELLSDIYSVLGACLLKTNKVEAAAVLQKAAPLMARVSAVGRGRLLGFRGTYYLSNNALDSALLDFEQALFLLEGAKVEAPQIARIYCNRGLALKYSGKYEEAFLDFDKAQQLWAASGYPGQAHACNNRALTFLDVGRYDKALENFRQALAIRKKFLPAEHPEILATYVNLGLAHLYRKELNQAETYLLHALGLALKIQKTDYLPSIYSNLGVAADGKKDYPRARSYFERAYALEKEFYKEGDNELVTTLFNIGTSYWGEHNTSRALEYFQEVARQADPDHPYMGIFLMHIGTVHLWDGRLAEAEASLQKALAWQEASSGFFHPVVAEIHYDLAQAAYQAGRYKKAFAHNLKAQRALFYQGNGNFQGVSDLPLLCQALSQQAKFSWANRHKLAADSLRAACQQALAAYEHLRTAQVNASDQQEVQELAHPIYEYAVKAQLLTAAQKRDTTLIYQSFTLAERSKAILLREALRYVDALQVAGIPSGLLQKERKLREEIASLESQRQEKLTSGQSNSTPDMLAIAGQLFELNQQHETLKVQFGQDYPKYYKAMYKLETPSVENIQQELLEPGQSLVEYLVGDSTIYIFLLQPNHFEVVEVKKDFPLKEWVEKMTKEGLYGFYTLPRNQRSARKESETIQYYTIAAQKLYDKLWAPIKDKLTEQIIVVPDGLLGYVPFEALLTGAPPREGVFSSYPYLIHQHTISYCYSAAMLREMQEKRRRQQSQGKLLAMAPFSKDNGSPLAVRLDTSDYLASLRLRDSLGVLSASGEEVAEVSQLLGGRPFYGAEASVNRFMELAPQYHILHLSTHGQANNRQGDYAFLAFGVPGDASAFEKLYARDLYALPLQADLVFLSACETGIGELKQGEGIISLARAFAYAGAKSIVTTLWKVNDTASKELTVAFYTYLKTGKHKDEALRQAKLDFLQQQKEHNHSAHPFFWAGFIGIGDMSTPLW